MDTKEIVGHIGEILDKLHEANVIPNKINCSEETSLLGEKSELDSLAFVTLIADLEEFFFDKLDREITIDLNKIQDFSAENPTITVKKMAQYLASHLASNS
jgi:acyl carrier protein